MKLTKIALSLAAGALAVAPAAGAHHQQGHQGGGGTGKLSLKAAPNPVKFGNSVTLSGKLTGSNNAARTVNLFADPYPYDTFSNVASAVTNASGDYSLTRKPA